MEEASRLDRITIEFPEATAAEAAIIAQECARGLQETGVQAENVTLARTQGAMDPGSVLVILGFKVIERAGKGLGGAIGRVLGRAAVKTVEKLPAAIERALTSISKRHRTPVQITGDCRKTRTIGGEFCRAPLVAGKDGTAGFGTLGIVILGASEFPLMKDATLNNAAFARSAKLARSMFGPPNTAFAKAEILDLFDSSMQPLEVFDAIERHIDTHPGMRDLLIYYCGHGSFHQDGACFLLRTTRADRTMTTGFLPRTLRNDLGARLLDQRVYFVVDACFSGSFVESLPSSALDSVVTEKLKLDMPQRGWSVLTASARDKWAMVPQGEDCTMFTGALAHVITNGTPSAGARFNLHDLAAESRSYLTARWQRKAALPQCISPEQSDGGLARLPIFVNSQFAAGDAPPEPPVKRETDERKTRLPSSAPLRHVPPKVAPQRNEAGKRKAAVRRRPGTLVAALAGHSRKVSSAVFSSDSRRILTASDDGTARLWDCKGGLLAVLRGHTGWVLSAVFSPNGRRILTASTDATARLWDYDGNFLAILEGHNGAVRSAVFSPDSGRILTASDDRFMRLWDGDDGKLLGTLNGRSYYSTIRAVFSPDGSRILTVSDDNRTELWDSAGQHIIAGTNYRTHLGPLHPALFSPDSRRVLTVGGHHLSVYLDGACLCDHSDDNRSNHRRCHDDTVRSAAFSPDGLRIVTVSDDSTAMLWDSKRELEGSTWYCKSIATLRGHAGPVNSGVFSPDSRYILTASYDKTARLWNGDGKELAVLRGHTGSVLGAVFSPDGRYALTASDDNTARLWAAESDVSGGEDDQPAGRKAGAFALLWLLCAVLFILFILSSR